MKLFSARSALFVFLAVTALSAGACRSSLVIRTKHELVQTGLYENDLNRLLEAYRTITPRKTTRDDLEKMGIKPEVSNIKFFGGFDAYQAAFGEAATRELSPLKFGEYLKELEPYTLIVIPFRDMKRKSDRIYFSRKDTDVWGWDVTLRIVLLHNLVVYRSEPNSELLETHETDKAFGQGIEEIFHGLNGTVNKVVK